MRVANGMAIVIIVLLENLATSEQAARFYRREEAITKKKYGNKIKEKNAYEFWY